MYIAPPWILSPSMCVNIYIYIISMCKVSLGKSGWSCTAVAARGKHLTTEGRIRVPDFEAYDG